MRPFTPQEQQATYKSRFGLLSTLAAFIGLLNFSIMASCHTRGPLNVDISSVVYTSDIDTNSKTPQLGPSDLEKSGGIVNARIFVGLSISMEDSVTRVVLQRLDDSLSRWVDTTASCDVTPANTLSNPAVLNNSVHPVGSWIPLLVGTRYRLAGRKDGSDVVFSGLNGLYYPKPRTTPGTSHHVTPLVRSNFPVTPSNTTYLHPARFTYSSTSSSTASNTVVWLICLFVGLAVVFAVICLVFSPCICAGWCCAKCLDDTGRRRRSHR